MKKMKVIAGVMALTLAMSMMCSCSSNDKKSSKKSSNKDKDEDVVEEEIDEADETTETTVDVATLETVEISASEYYTDYFFKTCNYGSNGFEYPHEVYIKMPDGYNFYPDSCAVNTIYSRSGTETFKTILELEYEGEFIIIANEDQVDLHGKHQEIYPTYISSPVPLTQLYKEGLELVEAFDNGISYYERTVEDLTDFHEAMFEYQVSSDMYIWIVFQYTFAPHPNFDVDGAYFYDERDQFVDFYRNVEDPFVVIDVATQVAEIVE